MAITRWTTAFLLATTLWSSASAGSHEPKDFFGGSNHEAFVSWFDTKGEAYADSSFLQKDGDVESGASIHWSIDDTHISLAVAVRATGWLSFGLSENGGMKGSDLFIFEAAKSTQIIDAHVLTALQPIEDDCQNWELIGSDITAEFMIVEVRRLIDTGDTQDRKLVRDGTLESPASLVIAAWGDEAAYGYHGTNKARGTVRWYNETLAGEEAFDTLMKAADGYFEMRAPSHPIKPIVTEYFEYCFTWDDLLAQGVPDSAFSVIGFRPIQDKVEHLHHYRVMGGTDDMIGKECKRVTLKYHPDLVYGWARGEEPMTLPSDVGLGIAGSSYKSFVLEIHYDNPELKEDVLDSSGIRLYYTKKPREKELGITQLGDPGLQLDGHPIGDGLRQHSFYCPSTCTDVMLNENVTVIREYLHMHYAGKSMTNELIRDGKVVHTGSVDFFDFDQQGNFIVQQEPFQVQKKDAFRTTCNYDNTGKNTTYGFSAEGEMCISYLFYYPKQSFLGGIVPWTCAYNMGFNVCEEEFSNISIDEVPRTFGRITDECVEPVVGIKTSGESSVVVLGLWFATMLAFSVMM